MKSLKTLLFLLSLTSGLFAQDVYISSNGDDANAGTEQSPFLSLGRALEEVEGNAAGRTIWIKGGTYKIENTVILNDAHSGNSGSPLTIRPMLGEMVKFTGGTQLDAEAFTVVTDQQELSRIPEIARGKVMVLELDDNNAGLFPSKSQYNKIATLSWNGFVLQLASFPNKGFAYFSETIEKGPVEIEYDLTQPLPPYSEESPSGGVFKVREEMDWVMLAKEFKRTKDMLLDGYLSNDWHHQYERVGGVDGVEEQIQLLRYTRYGIGNENIKLPRRFVLKNALTMLDQPGEWYYDRLTSKLYLWPVQPPTNQTPISILDDRILIDGSNCDNVLIRNINFQDFGKYAIRMSDVDSVLVAGCKFRSSNGAGVRLERATNSGVQSCDFAYMKQAMVVGGTNENRSTLTRENNFSKNNYIHHLTHKGYGMMGLSGMGSEFSNNLVHSLNGSLSYSGNDLTIQYNEFCNVGYEMGDWNVIYTNSDFSALGNRIKRNIFHHMIGTPAAHGIAPARTDDNGSGFHFDENIVYKTGKNAVNFYGPDNSLIGNVVMETPKLLNTQQRPYELTPESEWKEKTAYLQERYEEYLQLQQDIADGKVSFSTKDNKIGKGELIFGDSGWVNNQLWIDHYPHFANSFSLLEPNNNPWMCTHCDISRNYLSGGDAFPYNFHGNNTVNTYEKAWLMFPESSVLERVNSFVPEEMFEDPDKMDFRFKDSFTPVEGFNKWDVENVGLYLDEYRTSIPDIEALRVKFKERYENTDSKGGSYTSSTQDELNERYEYPEYLSLVTDYAVVDQAPVMYWPCDEATGKILKDYKGILAQYSDLTIPSIDWMVGVSSSGVGLSSSEHYLEASSDSLSGASAFAISTWVYLEGEASGQLIATGADDAQWSIGLNGDKVEVYADGTLYCTSASLTTKEWHHLVLNWDNSGAISLSVDGEQEASATGAPLVYGGTSNWSFGKLGANLGMDEVAVFKNALKPEEVKLIYVNGKVSYGMSYVIPVAMKEMSLSPNAYTLRKGFSLKLNKEVTPSNATYQAVNWVSSDPTVALVNDRGFVTGVADGEATITATSIHSNISAKVTVNVKSDLSTDVPMPDAYWPFDELEGDTAYDVIGDVHAVWQDKDAPQSWGDGLFGRAATFKGGDFDRFVTIGDPLLETDAFTISCWLNMNKTQAYEGIVTTRSSDRSNVWGLNAKHTQIDARCASKGHYTENAFATGKWTYMVMTWNNNGKRSVYVNGEHLSTLDDGVVEYISNNLWYFGDDVCCGGREIDGRIDELMMYRQELDAGQIRAIYDMGLQGFSTGDAFSTIVTGLDVQDETLKISIGEDSLLSALVLPVDATNQVIEWYSLNDDIVEVTERGLLTALKLGTAKVVCKTEEFAYTDTLEVEVMPNPVEAISLSQDTIRMKELVNVVLKASISPVTATDKSVMWHSSDESIATVTPVGVVRSLKEGIANITVESVSSGLKDTCVVIVEVVHVTSVSLGQKEMDVNFGDEIVFDLEILPADAKNKAVSYSSSDESVVSYFGEGYFDAISQGTAVLKVIALDGGISDSCIVRVDGGAAINTNLVQEGIHVYPNPAKEVLYLTFDKINSAEKIELVNAFGQCMKIISIENEKECIFLNGMPSGYYLIKVHINEKIVTSSFLKSE